MKLSPIANSIRIHEVIEERLRLEAQALKIAVARYEETMLNKVLDRELSNWRQQSWLRDTVTLKEYPMEHRSDGSVRRVGVYIKDRWVGGYDIKVSCVHDEIYVEGAQLSEEPTN